jgi:hypothetical protein
MMLPVRGRNTFRMQQKVLRRMHTTGRGLKAISQCGGRTRYYVANEEVPSAHAHGLIRSGEVVPTIIDRRTHTIYYSLRAYAEGPVEAP